MRFHFSRIHASFLMIASTGTACDRRAAASADDIARQFMTHAATGDAIHMAALLVPAEAALVAQQPSSLDDTGFPSSGIPTATVDSAHTKRQVTDTAVVDVYLTVPNYEQLMPLMLSRFMSGGMDTTNMQARMKEEIAKLPRVTRAREMTLVRTEGGWRVQLDLADRAMVARASAAISQAYRDDTLLAAEAPAKTILEVQRRRSDLVDSVSLSKAQDVVSALEVLPSIELSMLVKKTFFGANIDGFVRNKSARPIRSVRFRLTDRSGRSRELTVERIAPGGRKDVYELASLDEGKPTSVEVVWVNMGAWGY